MMLPFLELPCSTKYIDTLSGGEQRRVSFACAFIHQPELVLLDEPTVGMDILLKEKYSNVVFIYSSNNKY